MREEYSGWFVEVPRSLKNEFKKLYPGRSAQRRVTLAAIEWAIKSHPSKKENTNGKAEMLGTEEKRPAMQLQAEVQERAVSSAQSGQTGKASIPTEGLAGETGAESEREWIDGAFD